MFCQVCGALQSDDVEYCSRCNQKLLVVSGATTPEDQPFTESPEDSFSFDEHLLERISILEEVLKRTAETVRGILVTLQKQEKNILIDHTGLAALGEMLERRGVLSHDEWSDAWESGAQLQLLALEKREHFTASRDRMAALFRGEDRELFARRLDDAERALLSFDLEKALHLLEAALEMDLENYELAHFLGEAYFNEGDPEAALGYFRRVLAAKPDHYESLVYSGVLHYERGNLPKAELFLRRAAALYPESFLPLFSLGAICAGKGELDEAAAHLVRAAEMEDVPQAHYLLGSCYYEMGRAVAAIRSLKEAVRLDPAFEEAHHLLGLAYLDRHWNRKALESFRKAQDLNPKKMRYQDLVGYLSGSSAGRLPKVEGEAAQWLSRAEGFLSSENWNRALHCYRRALTLEPDNPTVLMSHAQACLQMKRHQESEATVRRVLDLDPGEMVKATAYATLIEALRGEGRFQEGNRVGTLLLDEGTSNFAKTIAYYEMAYNLAEMEEDLDRALDYARRSLDLAPDELKQFPLAALGWIHYKRREFVQAVDFLSRSSELGRSSTTLTHLGMALLASGEEERARNVLSEARSLGETGGALHERMMEFLRDSTRLFEALEFTDRRA